MQSPRNRNRFKTTPSSSRGTHRFKEPAGTNPYTAAAHNPKSNRSSIMSGVGIALLVVGVVLLIIAAVLFFRSEKEYSEGREAYERLAQLGPTEQNAEIVLEPGVELPLLDFTEIKAVNDDVVAWLTIPTLGINYPVVQGPDNDYYLRRNVERTYNKAGSLFMDYQSSADLNDAHTIIYGHNMNDGSMFQPIVGLADQATFDANRHIILYTPTKTYLLETVGVYKTDGSDETVRRFDFADDLDFHNYIRSKLDESVARDPEVTADSIRHLFTFSTCSYDVKDGRTIILATEVPTASVGAIPGQESTIGADGMPVLTEPSEGTSEATTSVE